MAPPAVVDDDDDEVDALAAINAELRNSEAPSDDDPESPWLPLESNPVRIDGPLSLLEKLLL